MSLLKTLEIMDAVCTAPRTMESLELLSGLSIRQIMRHIDEANHLGAQITSNGGRNSIWTCENAKHIQKVGILKQWLEIERNRSVIDSDRKERSRARGKGK